MAKSYTRLPEVPPELEPRYRAVLSVLTGVTSVTKAAESLGLTRVQFQTVMHRALAGLIEGLTPKPAGRPSKPAREAELEAQVEKLTRENARLSERTETIDRLLGVASGMLRGRVKASGRTAKARPKASEDETEDPEEPDGTRSAVEQMRSLGLTMVLVAAVVGVGVSTLRRQLRQRARLRTRVGHVETDAHTAALAEDLVRDTHGLVGADAIRHTVPGLSRRRAAAIKTEALRAVERERIERTTRVTVTLPGVVRGFDQLWVRTAEGLRPVLVSADACTPYRTSIVAVSRYDGDHVARAVDDDFRCHGPPLVWRADQASCHKTEQVDEVLAAWGVLRLHGPARHPGYYGQLERQNREHRGWLRLAPPRTVSDLERACEPMRRALNDRWCRRSQGWRTSAEVWSMRPALGIDRDTLRDEVDERVARLARAHHPGDAVAVWRLAIEGALQQRGYLRLTEGGWC
jgi:hypothetical protein